MTHAGVEEVVGRPGRHPTSSETEARTNTMIRLLKYAPIVVPLVIKAVKSPRGQRVIADVRARVQNRGDKPTGR